MELYKPGAGIYNGYQYINSLNPEIKNLVTSQLNFTKNTFENAQKLRDEILANGGTYEEARQAGPYIQNHTIQFMKIHIPLSCPTCGGKMYSVSYESAFSVLKKRSWQVCKECSFERNSEDFKKSIYCA